MADLSFVLIAGLAIVAGAVVQSSVGLGLGLVAAPVVALLDPSLMPGAMLIPVLLLPALTIWSEYSSVDWRGLGWALPGRAVGVAAGVWVVAALPPRLLAAGVGVMVLLAVALTMRAVRLRTTPATLSVAGVISGVTGTATSIGGPPVALVYQHEDAARVRATMGMYFLVGSVLSLAGLYLGGQLPLRQLYTGLALGPFVLLGFAVARPLRRVLHGDRLRVPLLLVVTASGAALLAQAVR